ncbi:MAG: hypothetical protein ACKV2T_43955 [Kofleriaceae bacterium]
MNAHDLAVSREVQDLLHLRNMKHLVFSILWLVVPACLFLGEEGEEEPPFCECDTTTACTTGCKCDPECDGEGSGGGGGGGGGGGSGSAPNYGASCTCDPGVTWCSSSSCRGTYCLWDMGDLGYCTNSCRETGCPAGFTCTLDLSLGGEWCLAGS